LACSIHEEVILLHVVTPLSYPAGVLESGYEITARDLHAHIVQRAQENLDQELWPDLDGVAVTRKAGKDGNRSKRTSGYNGS
jgi:hypothetical protein